ncbi:MAG: hypothetical protein ACPLUL_11405 [Thermanaerothrix sp.]|uniref:hypothetical protein n=1 Tax=Thermanaerothrix sp. TaxID=2972675 RepID=UPI003C7B3DAF
MIRIKGMVGWRGGLLVLWALGWALGGIGLVRRAFNLQPPEDLVVGLTAGLLVQGVLVNLVARFVPLPLSAWAISLLLGVGGTLAARRAERWRWPLNWGWWLGLAALVAWGYAMARGLAIFDDYAHLPTLSLIAAGDFPPHFAYDPAISYGYHHFLLLVSAQIMRVAAWTPWNALDAARALAFALALTLALRWGRRVTGHPLGAGLGALALLLASGTRWVLLVIPQAWLERLSPAVTLIGSGAASGSTLAEALLRPWMIEGGPPLPYPFAFGNGLLEPGILLLNAVNSLMPYAVILVLLLTATRWREPGWAGGLSLLVLAANHLMGETDLPLMLAGLAFITILWIVRYRNRVLPLGLRQWWGVVLGATVLAMVQGGTWGDLAQRILARLLGHPLPPSYQTLGFDLTRTPALVSMHLGVLPLTRPATLVVALCEAGPLLLALPLMAVWGWKAVRAGRWFEALLVAEALLSLPLLWVRFTGSTGVRNTTRLYAFLPIALILAPGALWVWLRQRASSVRVIAAGLSAVALLSGVVLLACQISAMGRPVVSYFLSGLDVRMYQAHWDRLDAGALVFDPNPSRAPTLFGRFTRAGDTWYHFNPKWLSLAEAPTPAALRAAGFTYAYLDARTWQQLPPAIQAAWQMPCVQEVDRLENHKGDFRWLLDVRACP